MARSKSDQFMIDAIKTESRLDRIEVDPELLSHVLSAVVGVGMLVDDMKKNIFYGKPVDYNHQFSVIEHTIQSLQILQAEADVGFVEEKVPLLVNPRIFHGIVGMFTETVEMMEILGEAIFETEDEVIDIKHLGEEIGDVDWYKAILHDATGLRETNLRDTVIAKLKKRYPGKFSAQAAINRDVEAERVVIEANIEQDDTLGEDQ
jgi:hypothetical protein